MMTKLHVSPERVLEIIEAYGSDPRRWPAEERDGVRQFLDAAAHGGDELARASALDAVLSSLPAGEVSTDLTSRILGDAAEILGSDPEPSVRAPGGKHTSLMDRMWQVLWPEGFAWQRGSLWAASAALGIFAGIWSVSILEEPWEPGLDGEDVMIMAFAPLDSYDEW